MKKGFVRGVCLVVLGAAANGYAMQGQDASELGQVVVVDEEKMEGLSLAQTKRAFVTIDRWLCVNGKKLSVPLSAPAEQTQDAVGKVVWGVWLKHMPTISSDCLDAIAKRHFEQRSDWAVKMTHAIGTKDCASAARLLRIACWARAIFLVHEERRGPDSKMRYIADPTHQKVILPLLSNDKTALQKCKIELEEWESKTKIAAEAWRGHIVGDLSEYSDTYDEYLKYLSSDDLQVLSEDKKKSALQHFVMDDEWGSVTAAVAKKYRDRAQCAGEAGQLISGSPVFDEDTRVLAYSRLMGMAEKNELVDNLDRATHLRVLAQQVCSIVDESDARQLREQVLQEFAKDFSAFSKRAAVWQLSTSPVAANAPGASDHQNYGAEGAGVGELIQSGC